MTINNNEKETMKQAFSCEDSPKSFKNQGSLLRRLRNSFLRGLKRSFLNGLKSLNSSL